jgi:hypothetical protein
MQSKSISANPDPGFAENPGGGNVVSTTAADRRADRGAAQASGDRSIHDAWNLIRLFSGLLGAERDGVLVEVRFRI